MPCAAELFFEAFAKSDCGLTLRFTQYLVSILGSEVVESNLLGVQFALESSQLGRGWRHYGVARRDVGVLVPGKRKDVSGKAVTVWRKQPQATYCPSSKRFFKSSR